MLKTVRLAAIAAATAGALATFAAGAQAPANAPLRPKDPTANLPSDTGSQTVIPGGAVTGAGQPQGMTKQQDVGAPGGLERRARTEARREAAADSPGTAATAREGERSPQPGRRTAGEGRATAAAAGGAAGAGAAAGVGATGGSGAADDASRMDRRNRAPREPRG